MRKKIIGNKDNSQIYESDREDVVRYMKATGKKKIYESDWLELARYGFIQNVYPEFAKEQKEIEKDIRKFHKAEDIKAFNESCMKFEHLSWIGYFIMGEYKKIFELSLNSSRFFQYHLTISDCFSIYYWISDNLVSFMMNNEISKYNSHDVIVYVYDIERKKLDSVFEEFLKKFTAGKSENNGPISETIEQMIRKNKLLPDLDPVTKKYTTSGSTPDTIAWLKLNNLHKVFPPKLFNVMINTKCKPWIIEKYYRDL